MNKKEQELEKQKIKNDVITRINKGEPKQQILEELSHVYKNKATIVKHLESTPSKLMKHKYRMFNLMLAALLLAALVLDTLLLVQLQLGKNISTFFDIFRGRQRKCKRQCRGTS